MSIISLGHSRHSSIRVHSRIGLSHVHAIPFTTYLSNNGCIIQPPIHELDSNTNTPMSFSTVLEKHFSKEDAPDTRTRCDTRMCHMVAHLSLKTQEEGSIGQYLRARVRISQQLIILNNSDIKKTKTVKDRKKKVDLIMQNYDLSTPNFYLIATFIPAHN